MKKPTEKRWALFFAFDAYFGVACYLEISDISGCF